MKKKCDSIGEAKDKFSGTYKDKTNNEFGSKQFVKYHGFYYQLLNADEKIKNGYRHAQSSTLDKRIENLLKRLIDNEIMENLMVRLHLDPIKMPLATIGSQQIKDARFVLNEIEETMKNGKSASYLKTLSTKFYHLIPHTLTRHIDSKQMLNEKRELLEELGELHFTYELIDKVSGTPVNNLLDKFYTNLNVQIGPLDSDSDEFGAIKEYLGNNPFKHDMEIEDIFKIERNEEEDDPMEGVPTNRWLLWHGSRITSFAKILKEGLKIPDVEGMFGKGIYFADVADKSAKYCYAHETDGIGLMVLCEVALGKEFEYYKCFGECLKPPNGFNSIFAVGKFRFPENSRDPKLKLLQKIETTQIDGVNIPKGKPEMMNFEKGNEPIVDCNEFVVYNENQVEVRYLVKLKIGPKNRNASQLTFALNRYGI